MYVDLAHFIKKRVIYRRLDLSWSLTSRFQLSENVNRSRSRRMVLLDGGLTELSDLASVKQTKTIEKSLIGVLAWIQFSLLFHIQSTIPHIYKSVLYCFCFSPISNYFVFGLSYFGHVCQNFSKSVHNSVFMGVHCVNYLLVASKYV